MAQLVPPARLDWPESSLKPQVTVSAAGIAHRLQMLVSHLGGRHRAAMGERERERQ